MQTAFKETHTTDRSDVLMTNHASVNLEYTGYWRMLLIRNGILFGFLIAFVYHFLFCAQVVGLPAPYNTFLFRYFDRFNDFFNIYFFNFGPYVARSDWGGFPLNFMLCSLLNVFDPYVALFLFLVSCTAITITYTWKTIGSYPYVSTLSDSTIIILFSYPFITMIDRANTDYFILVFLMAFDALFLKKQYIVSSIFLGLAIAVKPFSVVYLALFIKDHQFISVFTTITTSVLVTFLCLLSFNGGFIDNSIQWLTNLNDYQKDYGYGYDGTIYSCSVFALIKFVGLMYNEDYLVTNAVAKIGPYYFAISSAVYVAVVGVVYLKGRSHWMNLALLTICSTALPFCCGDYRLVYFILPLSHYLSRANSLRHTFYKDVIYCFLFVLLFIPKHYYFIHAEVSISQLISPITLVIMMSLLIYDTILGNREYKASPQLT